MSVGVRQHTQDVRGCPCVSVCIRLCSSAHKGHPWLTIGTHISTLFHGLSTLALPVDCLGDFGPRGLSVQYTQVVCGCPPAHTDRMWMSVCVRVCPCVSVSTHRTSVAVHQYTYQHAVHTGRLCVCQHTQDVFVCPSAHTGRPWLSFSTHMTYVAVRVSPCVSVSTHRTSVAVHQYTYQHVGPLTQHADPSRGLFGTSVAVCVCPCVSVCVHQYKKDILHTGRLWVSASTHRTSVAVCGCPSAHTGRPTHRTSVAVHQYTSQHVGPWTQHAGRPWLSVRVRVCPLAHTHDGRLWLSISTHISTLDLGLSTLVLGLSTLALPVDCSGDFGPLRLSVQYT
ncbi:hypothetical protein YC2023_066302 [Brassica napus]